jgi:uncharacterized protein
VKNFWQFIFVLFVLSIPFWVLGAYAKEFVNYNPMKLPISALMTFCPLIAAVFLTYQYKEKVSELLKLSFDYKKISSKKWYIPILLTMPTIAFISYLYLYVINGGYMLLNFCMAYFGPTYYIIILAWFVIFMLQDLI